jgi:polyhydroxybutyrate depolymerase
VERRYLLHVPRGHDSSQRLPAVLMFHGAGASAAFAVKDTHWADKADQAGFLAVFPEGMSVDPFRPASFRLNPQFWNDGSGQSIFGPAAVDDVAFVDQLLDELIARFAVDPRRIFLTGFSSGGALCFALAVALSRRIAAIAPVASHCWLPDPRPLRPVPTIHLIGTRDPLIPLEGGEVRFPWGGPPRQRPPVRDSIRKWARALGCPPEPRSQEDKDGVRVEFYGPGTENAELHWYVIEGMGHFWPGSRAQLPERWFGKPSDRLKATDVIWEFFAGHPRK